MNPLHLPLDEAWPEIAAALARHTNLVLVAAPGAGKTTRFPPQLLRSRLLPEGSRVLMLEPRRIAARASAHRIAEEQGWKVGEEVGYQVRFENHVGPRTRLAVLTEGLLAVRLKADPELRDVSAVILDEFHERSRHTDLALGLLYELQQLARPDLRIIVMSATLDAERVSKYLGDCPQISVPGRLFPIDVHHAKLPLSLDTGAAFLDRTAEHVLTIAEGRTPSHGDLLVFLPGTREIRGVRERVASRASTLGFDCLELHGSLPLAEQDRALRPAAEGRRKIILATNIAETSLTIDGVGTVLDTGLARETRIDSAGFERLTLARISLASATQRSGRAGRQSAGHAYRLWSKLDEVAFPPFGTPEVLRTDLTDTLLSLQAQGVTDPEAFSWFEAPPPEALKLAQRSLADLSLIDGPTGGLSALGREALTLPVEPRLARLLVEATRLGRADLGARLAALLSERDIAGPQADFRAHAHSESDVLARLALLESPGTRGRWPSLWRVIDALEASARRLSSRTPTSANVAALFRREDSQDELVLKLLLCAFPDRICRRRRAKEPAARMIGGRGVSLSRHSLVETAEFFVALQAREPIHGPRSIPEISLASRLDRAWLETFFRARLAPLDQIIFDEATRSVQKQRALAIDDLPLEEPQVSRPSADEAFDVLVANARERWDVIVGRHAPLAHVLKRIEFLRTHDPEALEDFTLDELRDRTLEEACFNETRLSAVEDKPLAEIALRQLPQNLARRLHEEAPDTIQVPSGSHLRIEYPENRAPYLEVRIQEVFGWATSPKLARGRVPLVLHLFGPNFRPVQVTSDLQSFWATGYAEVRKELRTRYPKHKWPEDPMTATAEAKGRRRPN